ncbi:MAG: flagellar export chaperone FlgN [Candidatus Eisenbacteria sp.]|nr:flagellar export chaperone FlgN [Candidatus Eisenbacteria bacterium]
MRGEAKDWRTSLMTMLAEASQAYERLGNTSLDLRRALIQGELPKIRDQVAAHQDLLTVLAQIHEQCATFCRQGGLLAPDQPFAVGRLEAAPAVRADEPLHRCLSGLQASARRSAQEMQHNRYLIARLTEWTEKEMRLVLEPLFESAGYLDDGATRRGPTHPAMIDRRG